MCRFAGTVRHGLSVDIACAKGDLVVITGPVGSGKSTLLATLARALLPLTGKVIASDQRAYVAQRPFLAEGSIEENILFGLERDDERLRDAVRRAQLSKDLESLSNGLEARVGPAGVQLSGGQRARVALARALYAKPSLCILDDVLSAVDAHTGAALWSDAVVHLRDEGCCVVLATHQLHYASRSEVSRVVSLGECSVPRATNGHIAVIEEEEAEEDVEEHPPLEDVEKALREALTDRYGQVVDAAFVADVIRSLRGSRVEERRREGFIAYGDVRLYLDAFGKRGKVLLLLLLAFAGCGLGVGANVWLSDWADGALAASRCTRGHRTMTWVVSFSNLMLRAGGGSRSKQLQGLTIYVLIGGVQAFVLALQTIILTLCALDASKTLHAKMLTAVISTSMAFFDATPIGSILNRFLQDLANVDMDVPTTTLDQLTRTLDVTSQLGLVLFFAPFVALSLPLILIPYVFIFRTVRIAARDARRLEAEAHGPCYAHFHDCIRGRGTIRAFGAVARFERQNEVLTDRMATGRYANEAVCKCDLGVPRCCRAFTPSTRLVSIRRGRGSFYFDF